MNADDVISIARLLLEAALRGTVLLLVALGATRLMKRSSAAARHLIWATALAAFVLLPITSHVAPTWQLLPLSIPTSAIESAPDAASSIVTPSAERAGSVPNRVELLSRTPLSQRPALSTALAFIWVAGAVLLLARLLLGAVRVWHVQRAAIQITAERWVRSVDTLARQLQVSRSVTLLRSTTSSVPMTWGLVRPVILLPAAADGWSDDLRRSVLTHELAHIRRFDALTQWIAHLATVLFWFHPLVWFAVRKLEAERERACDDAVLALGARPTRYASDLLAIAQSLRFSDGPVTTMAMARPTQLEGRLLAILDRTASRSGVTRGIVMATLGVAAVVIVPVSAIGAIAPIASTAQTAQLPDASRDGNRGVERGSDQDEWTTDMSLSEGELSYDELRNGEQWQIGLRGKHFRVQSNGKLTRVFVQPSGELELHESGPGRASVRVHIRADAAGRETRTYSVGGRERAHDATADAWTSEFLERLTRHLNKRSSRS